MSDLTLVCIAWAAIATLVAALIFAASTRTTQERLDDLTDADE